MKNYFSKYKRFLGAFFLLWLFLRTAGFFGFNFGVDIFLLFRLVLFLGVAWAIMETWVNWDAVYPVLKTFSAKQKSEFASKIKTTQAEIIAFSPKVLGGRIGGWTVLPLAVVFGVFGGFKRSVKSFFQLLFSKNGALFLVALGILGDIFVLDFNSNLIIVFLTALWILAVRRWKFEGRISVAVALAFLVMCPFLLIFEKDLIAEKSAIWAYMFLVVGVIQMFVENVRCEERGFERREC